MGASLGVDGRDRAMNVVENISTLYNETRDRGREKGRKRGRTSPRNPLIQKKIEKIQIITPVVPHRTIIIKIILQSLLFLSTASLLVTKSHQHATNTFLCKKGEKTMLVDKTIDDSTFNTYSVLIHTDECCELYASSYNRA